MQLNSIDFIPIHLYTPIYYHILLVFTLVTLFHTLLWDYKEHENIVSIKISGGIIFAFVLFYMGLRPTHEVFVDMTAYHYMFDYYKVGGIITTDKDLLFNILTLISSKVMSAQMYFFLCATIYVLPAYIISKKWFKELWFYAFLLLVGSFSFWSYGTNGIRNGLATAMFLMALASDNRKFQILFLLLSIGFHKSMMLPVAGFIATWFYNNPKTFLVFWMFSIPLSLTLPGVWESLFASAIEDDRARYLTTEASSNEFSKVGFRWDFLIYSATGVIAGWWYIFKKNLHDKEYLQLFNTYLFANAFWILVIRANFSNRFAYLSWFLLALVIVYPWVKYRFTNDQHKKFGLVIMAYFGFSYVMAIFL